ncbi:hypothetical protein ACNS7O_02915 [Haloferacaceae archaeon DSL9]
MSSSYERLADLPLRITGSSRSRNEAETTSEFVRATTTIELHGVDETGRGEDVTYDTEDHDALANTASFDLAGEYTLESFSRRLDEVDLFPTKAPERKSAYHYRRWALESAALDLALRQAETSLAEALDRRAEPVRFVASTRLGSPPTTARIEELRDHVSDLEFKLDPTEEWDAALVEAIADLDAVRIVDLKGWYEGTTVDQAPDPELYDLVATGFPHAIIEDPAITPETTPILDAHADRLSFDAPITSVDDVESIPYELRWLNIKPSRFGTVEALLETIDHCERNGITCYGGGQFELDVGRRQIQALASVWYPDSPNDVAPRAYNVPTLPDSLPSSPLRPSETAVGFAF